MHVSLLIGGGEFGMKYLFMHSVNFEETQWFVDWGDKYICPIHPLSLENNISAQQKWHIFFTLMNMALCLGLKFTP
jgi:hypothetical protein